MRDHGRKARCTRRGDRFEGFRQSADLVHLHQDRVCGLLFDAALQDAGVRDKKIVTHDLHLVTYCGDKLTPTRPVGFGEAVFDRHDGVVVDPFLPEGNHFAGGLGFAFAGEHVLAVFVDLARRRVEGDKNVFARSVARLFDRFTNKLDRFAVAAQVGREPAFIPNGRRIPLLLQDAAQRVKNFGTPAQRFAKARCAEREEHELLQVDVVVRVGATINDVHHRGREHVGVWVEETIKGRLRGVGGRVCRGE